MKYCNNNNKKFMSQKELNGTRKNLYIILNYILLNHSSFNLILQVGTNIYQKATVLPKVYFSFPISQGTN